MKFYENRKAKTLFQRYGEAEVQIINPVISDTLRLWHCSKHVLHRMMKNIARELYNRYRLIINGISYIDEEGRLRAGTERTGGLCMNRMFSYDKVK